MNDCTGLLRKHIIETKSNTCCCIYYSSIIYIEDKFKPMVFGKRNTEKFDVIPHILDRDFPDFTLTEKDNKLFLVKDKNKEWDIYSGSIWADKEHKLWMKPLPKKNYTLIR